MRTRLLVVLAALALPAVAAPPVAAHEGPRISVYFGLPRPEAQARSAFFAVQQPGSSSYRGFLSRAQVAQRYGVRAGTVRRLQRFARRRGLTVRVDPTRVFARMNGPVRRLERVFRVRFKKQFDNEVFANTWYLPRASQTLHVPRALRPLVREVVPVFARSTKRARSGPAPGEELPRARATQGVRPGNAGTWTGGCAKARATGSYAFGQVREAYGLDGVGTGAGASVAIMNVGEGIPQVDLNSAAACFGYPALRPRTLLTDGQSRPFGRGSPEPQEDVALARGMAPELSSLMLTQAWLLTELWFLGPAQVLRQENLPDTLSISYGLCERSVRGRGAGPTLRAGATLMDALLVRLGLAGVATFASVGDFGSTCNGSNFAGIAWPASSPYLTAVGGSRLVVDAANERVDEVVWNDLPWVTTDNGGGAGGGGLSQFSQRPPFQGGLTVPGSRRAAPDVAAHASLLPAWPVNIGSNWLTDGGTSASAPLVASAFAIVSARERAAGRPPLGPVNGLLYSLPASDPAGLFDIVSGNNAYSRRVPPQTAGPGYDLASGLGVPRFDRIAAALPPPAP